jgi:hypothetical protein
MSTHTQGNWTVHEQDGKLAVVADGLPVICVLVKQYDPAVTMANAKLLASAPALLEALEGVVKIADRDTVEFIKARAVIARARGQS